MAGKSERFNAWPNARLSYGRFSQPSTLSQQTESVYVVGQIPQTYLSLGPGYANGSYQQAAGPHSLDSKDMFNSAANLGASMIALPLTAGKFFIPAALSMDTVAKALAFKDLPLAFVAISRVSPYVFAAIVLIKNLLKHFAVMHRRIGNFIFANELVLDIYVDVILVAVVICAVFLYPACISVFLAFFIFFLFIGNFAVFNCFVFLPAVALFASRHYTGIHDLTFLGTETVLTEKLVKSCKQLINQTGVFELFPEKPYGSGIRDSIAYAQTEKTHKREPVINLKLKPLVRKIVHRLQKQNLEHKHHIKRPSPGVGFSLFVSNCLKYLAELFPIQDFVEFDQWIAATVQLFETSLPIEKP